MHVTPRTERLSTEAGQVIAIFALLLPIIFGIGAVVLDVGNWYIHKRHLQTQVDAAALAAATTFTGCFHDAATANIAIASTALAYAGDTARDASSRNQQVQTPGNVRVTLNSQRYWSEGDPTTPTTNGYGAATNPVGDNSAGTPCATSTLDVKATDVDAPRLFSWLGLRPDIKAHARIEIRRVKEESGLLPLAVPEIDPNYVYAIFVDYSKDGTQTPFKVQELKKDASSFPSTFPYSGWIAKTESEIPGNTQVFVPSNTATGVVILVSKSDTAPSKSGTLDQICTQPPSSLVACYAGTGSAGYNGAATGQGLALIHGFRDALGAADDPLVRDVQLGGMVCTGGIGPGNITPSAPYYINDDSDCTVGVTAKVDFGTPDPPGAFTIEDAQSKGGVCAQLTSSPSLTWTLTGVSPTAPYISTWTSSMTVPVAGGPQTLNLTAQSKTGPNLSNCSSRNHTDTGSNPVAVSYATDDNSGPVGYLALEALGPNGSTACPAGSTVIDAHSTARGDYCYSVKVGLDQPLALKPWDSPSIVLRFASKAARKGGSGTANLNGSLLCDHGRTLEDTFTTGCYTTYALNYDKWGTGTTPYGTTTSCTPGVDCWEDILCAKYSPSDLPPMSTVNNPAPDCISAKNGKVNAFEQGLYNRFEDMNNGFGGCSRNNWPTTQAQADQFFKSVEDGGYDFTNDPRYITLIVTDNTAFSSPNTAEPVKYFAGFYATGWDTANGAGKPDGCYGFVPVNTCGNPNNDAHPLLGCYPGTIKSSDNGDLWGHFVKFVGFSASGTPSDSLCSLTSTSAEACIAVLVE